MYTLSIDDNFTTSNPPALSFAGTIALNRAGLRQSVSPKEDYFLKFGMLSEICELRLYPFLIHSSTAPDSYLIQLQKLLAGSMPGIPWTKGDSTEWLKRRNDLRVVSLGTMSSAPRHCRR